MHALWKINKRTRKYLACLLLRGVCPAWNGGVIIKNSRCFLNFFILLSFFSPSFPLLGNGHWRTQARHHLFHHGGCVHHQRRWCAQQAQAGGDQRRRSVKCLEFCGRMWWPRTWVYFWGCIDRLCWGDGVNYFEISTFLDRLWGLQHPCWVVCLSISNEIPEANVCTVQSLLFFWTLSLVSTTRHTSLTRPLEPVWKLAALAWTWGRLPASMKAFFQKIEGSKPI